MNLLYDNLKGDAPLPDWARKKNIKNCFFYTGKSMYPTFKQGQLIYSLPKCDIVAYDIIIFKEKGLPIITVHRVVSVSETGYIARGDNNSFNDACPVVSGQILGVAKYFEEKGHVRPVPSGKVYFARLKLRWRVSGVLKKVKRPVASLYRILKKSGIMYALFGKWFKRQTRKILLTPGSEFLTKTIFLGKTIILDWPARNIYRCKKPFDLIVAERKDLNT